MSELLPCPHCGETEHLYPSYRDFGKDGPYAVDCLGCGADYVPREGFDVIALWNRRTPDTVVLTDRIKQLEEALRPFARMAAMTTDEPPGKSVVINVDRLRDAARVLDGGSDADA